MDQVTGNKYSRTISTLANRRQHIQMLINEEMRKRAPCSTTLVRLKKARLRAKDQIAALSKRIAMIGRSSQGQRHA